MRFNKRKQAAKVTPTADEVAVSVRQLLAGASLVLRSVTLTEEAEVLDAAGLDLAQLDAARSPISVALRGLHQSCWRSYIAVHDELCAARRAARAADDWRAELDFATAIETAAEMYGSVYRATLDADLTTGHAIRVAHTFAEVRRG